MKTGRPGVCFRLGLRLLFSKISGDFGELGESGLQILDDFRGNVFIVP